MQNNKRAIKHGYSRILIGILSGVLHIIAFPTLSSLFDLQQMYLTLLGPLILSLLFLDKVFDGLRNIKDPGRLFQALKEYYSNTMVANIILIGFFFISYAYYKGTYLQHKYFVDTYILFGSQYIIAAKCVWLFIYGYLCGYMLYSYFQLARLIISLRMLSEEIQSK
jgi:hypothetical protein